MASETRKSNKKAIILTAILAIVLLVISATGTVIFLKNRGSAEATELENSEQQNQEQNSNQQTETPNENNQPENPNGNVENTNPVEENGEQGENTPNNLENANNQQGNNNNVGNANNQQGNNNAGNANNGNTGVVDNIQETTITRTETVEIPEQKVLEGHYVGWYSLQSKAEIASANITPQSDKENLKIEKTAQTKTGENLATAGEEVTYNIKITNNSETRDLSGIDVKDVIPEMTTYKTSPEENNRKEIMDENQNVIGLSWKVNIPAKETVIVSFTVTVNEDATNTIKNIAMVNGEPSNEGEETKVAIIESNKTSVITRNENVITEPAKVGDKVTYTISVKNTGEIAGTTTIKDADLEKILSDNKAELVGNVEIKENNKTIVDNKTAQDLINGLTNVNIPANGETKVIFTIKINNIDGKITNIATIGDGKPTNPEEIETVDIKVEKHTTQKEVKVGEEIKYTITLINNGSKAGTVKVSDPLPEGTQFISSKMITAEKENEIVEQKLVKGIDVTVTPNETITIEVVVKAVAKTTTGEDTKFIKNIAYIGDEKPEEPVPSEEVKVANISAVKSSDYEGELNELDTITYAITLTNKGEADGTVKVSDQIPEGTTFVENSIKVNGEGNYTLEDLTTNGIDVNVAKDNGTAVLTFQVKVNPFKEATKQIVNAQAKKDEEPVNPTEDTAKKEYENVTGTKTWIDPQGTIHPEITINLLQDGTQIDSKTLANGKTEYTFTNLDKYAEDGHVYVYTVTENTVEGYTTTINGTSITNTINQEKINVNGTKTWIDPEGTTHPEITINLLQDGTKIDSTTLANGETEYSFANLDKYAEDGHVYAYTVTEDTVEGYTTSINGTSITNTIEQEKISVNGTKTWIDPQGTIHPTITINLLQDGTKIDSTKLTNGETEYSFTDLDKYAEDGHIYNYTVTENAVAGYTTAIDGTSITNTIEQEKITVNGTKVWVDPENTTHPEITISLLQDGTQIKSTTLANGETEYSFTDLDKYAEDGHIYIYTVSENEVAGYTSIINGYTITNTIAQEKISVDVEKIWIDPENTTHPEITINLLQDGTQIKSTTLANGETEYTFTDLDKYATDGHIYNYTITENKVAGYTSSINGYTITNTIAQEKINVSGTKTWIDPQGTIHPEIIINLLQDGTKIDSKTLANGKTEYTFTNLDKYAEDGHVYNYTVTEDAVEGYTTSIDGYTITNTIEQEKIKVDVEKVWIDPEEITHPEITINLLRDGTQIGSITLENGETEYSFTELDKYATDGHIYAYTVTENPVIGYTTPTINKTDSGYQIVNTISQEKRTISGTKTWTVQETEYPTVTINLLRDTQQYATTIIENGETRYSFNNLDTYDLTDGHAYVYEVTENPIDGYISEQDGTNFINTKIVPSIDVKKEISGIIVDGKETSNITSDAQIKGREGNTIIYTITAKNDGNATLTGIEISDTRKVNLIASILPERISSDIQISNRENVTPNTNLLGRNDITLEPGEEITLTVSYELQRADVLGNADFENRANAKGTYNTTIVNDHDEVSIETEFEVELGSKTFVKQWNDTNYESCRPEKITVQLLKNGTPEGEAVEIDTSVNTYTWNNLPLEDEATGETITYSVREVSVPDGYTASNCTIKDGNMTITNTYNKPTGGTVIKNRTETSTTQVEVPVDVVFIMDTSGSMKDNSRAKSAVNAVNSAMTTILNAGEHNRVSVVGYSGTWDDGSNDTDANVLLKLGRYDIKDTRENQGHLILDNDKIKTNVTQLSKQNSRYVDGGTYTQIGIAEGTKQLINSSEKTVTINGKQVTRIPVIILLSDGEPTLYSESYNNVTSNNRQGDGSKVSADKGYYTILSANYYKNEVAKSYYGESTDKSAKMYTIAMDMTETYGISVLNPNDTNMATCSTAGGEAYKLYDYLTNGLTKREWVSTGNKPWNGYWKEEQVPNPYANNYSYADKAYAGSMNEQDLKDIMKTIIENVIPSAETTEITETQIASGKVELSNLDVNGEFTLTAGDKTYNNCQDAITAEVIVGNEINGYYIDLSKLPANSTVTISYTAK